MYKIVTQKNRYRQIFEESRIHTFMIQQAIFFVQYRSLAVPPRNWLRPSHCFSSGAGTEDKTPSGYIMPNAYIVKHDMYIRERYMAHERDNNKWVTRNIFPDRVKTECNKHELFTGYRHAIRKSKCPSYTSNLRVETRNMVAAIF